jgi:hypothetical protein
LICAHIKNEWTGAGICSSFDTEICNAQGPVLVSVCVRIKTLPFSEEHRIDARLKHNLSALS